MPAAKCEWCSAMSTAMPESKHPRISLVGDVCVPAGLICGTTAADLDFVKSSFTAPFEGTDLILCNLEAPISDRTDARENKKYNLKNDPAVLELLDKRFVLSLANNHMMDYGEEGLTDTIGRLQAAGFAFAGAGRNIEEASQPAYVHADSMAVAMVCAADPRFQPAGPTSAGVLPARPEVLEPIIAKARQRAECVVVSIHAGMEFTPVPTPFMMNLADGCLNAGASVVCYHHAHCLSGCTRKDEGLILWGVGNYAFPYILPRGYSAWFRSAVWNVTINNSGAAENLDIVPITLNPDGIPSIARGRAAEQIKATIDKCSRRMESGKSLGLWRLCSVVHPAYIWMALNNYSEMARRTGVRSVLSQIVNALLSYGTKGSHVR